MKRLLLCGAALALVSACGSGAGGNSDAIDAALTQMSLNESGLGRTEYAEKTVSGDDVVFKNVVIRTSELAGGEDETEEVAAVDEFGEAVELFEEPTEDDFNVDIEGSDLLADTLTFKGLSLNDAGQSAFSAMSLDTISFLKKDDTDTGTATIGNIALSNPSPELANWVGSVLGAGEKADVPDAENVSFDALTLTDFLATDTENGEGSIGIASINIKDYGGDKAGLFELSGLVADFIDDESGEAGMFKLGGISIKGANTEFLKAFEEDTEEEMTSAFTDIVYSNPIDPGFDKFSIADMAFEGGGLSFSLPKMDYDISRNSDDIPTEFTIPDFTMTLDVDPDGGSIGAQVAPMLAALGLDGINMKMGSVSTYDPESDIAVSPSGFIEIEDVMKFSMTSKMGGLSKLADAMKNMDPEAFANGEQDPSAMMLDVYSQLDFHNFSISIEDNGIVDQAFTLAALQQGVAPADLKTQVVGMVSAAPFFAQSMGIDAGIAAEFAAAASSFLQEGGTMTISLDPESPFTIPQLMSDPTSINKQVLGFSATTE